MGAHPKVWGMWAGFIYLFNCACMDQLTLPGSTHMRCWFQTQRGVPPAVPSSALPRPPHPHSLIPLAFEEGHAGKEEAYHCCTDAISQSTMSVLTTCSAVPGVRTTWSRPTCCLRQHGDRPSHCALGEHGSADECGTMTNVNRSKASGR